MSSASIGQTQNEDALALAWLLYEIFKEKQAGDKVEHGQNNANRTEDV